MKKRLEQIIKVLVCSTFFVPLLVVPSSFIFPFIVPKILLLRALITLMSGGYVILLAINWEKYRPRATPISLALLLFLASFFISTLAGIDSYHSFWDNHERMLGLFTIMHYVAYYFVVTALFRNWTDWKMALRLFLIAGAAVMFIGLLQKSNPQFLLNQGSDRVASTLGNAIYVGGYGLFLFFVAALLVAREKNIVWRFIEGGLGLLALVGIFLSGTRGSILGMGFGLAVAAVGYIVVLQDAKRQRQIKIIITAILILCGAAFLNRATISKMDIPGVSRLLGTSLLPNGINSRYIAWNIAVESWKERPIFGWGPNNYFYAFNQHYNPRSLELGYGETWFDNAHNIILNTLAVQGIVGLLSYLAIFFVAGGAIWRAGRSGKVNIHVMVIGIAFLGAHLVQNIFVFENPTSYLYFMFWLAFMNRSSSARYFPDSDLSEGTEGDKQPDRAVGLAGAGVAAALCVLVIFIFDIQPARANMKTLDAMTQLAGDPMTGLAVVREALAFDSPHIDDIRSDLSRELIDVINRAYTRLSPATINDMLTVVADELEKNLSLHPRDIRLYMMLAQVGQLRFMVNNDARYLLSAEHSIAESIAYSPHRQQLLYMLATIKAQLNKKNEAIQIMEQAIADDNRIGEGYWRLAYLYNFYKDTAKAKEILNLARQNGINFDAQGQQVEAMVNAAEATVGTKK